MLVAKNINEENILRNSIQNLFCLILILLCQFIELSHNKPFLFFFEQVRNIVNSYCVIGKSFLSTRVLLKRRLLSGRAVSIVSNACFQNLNSCRFASTLFSECQHFNIKSFMVFKVLLDLDLAYFSLFAFQNVNYLNIKLIFERHLV